MGWNFGCVIIGFDFRKAVDEWLEPERRQYLMGNETPEELHSKALIDTGLALFEALDVAAAPDDAPISFDDASSRFFEDYAVGLREGKTVLVGQRFGLAQDAEKFCAAYGRISVKHGPVFAFWFNDASDSYMMSVFLNGTRVRFLTTGEGLDDNHGECLEGELDADAHGHDRLMSVLEAAAGCTFGELLDVKMERFSPC